MLMAGRRAGLRGAGWRGAAPWASTDGSAGRAALRSEAEGCGQNMQIGQLFIKSLEHLETFCLCKRARRGRRNKNLGGAQRGESERETRAGRELYHVAL